MTTVDFITELYCKVDDAMAKAEKHVQAKLRPSGDNSDIVCLERSRQPSILSMARTRLFATVSEITRTDTPVSIIQQPPALNTTAIGGG